MNNRGILFVLSGPSGSGKGTAIKELMGRRPLKLSVSATTRAPRPGEVDGVQYYFLSKEEFERRIADGEMLEYVNYCGNYYGTPKAPVEESLAAGQDVLLEIEVTGAKNIRTLAPEATLLFVIPPSMKELRRRLEGRGTEDAATIERRLAVAKEELRQYGLYDYVVLNDTVESCADQIETIMEAQKRASRYMGQIMERVMEEC
ncbi:guanylate kinase [Acetanaerobacterium sp. MSJ-12]|uniref:Guanylate kinase n=1 Tax=Bittarella massiliensis (ex Durand et al. 2017) TaxID=1720313 RepID=A0AAW5K7V4_9FIRM|nr:MULTISPECIES: guanylate kinase [Oscillospiraceae]MCB5941300.1 guanylate kinase [bacterium 210820-DFI.6.52]MBC2870495.1 guanylate kinase [Bittarella massiliensis (ex Durand et al. 2017)]MBO1678424.1 guanylate kinase [Bittarella massiliensis (ex Durand et al. 2017)]MBU5421006.1 guanylate kinase [Acetanaerobacterium sp. MSJ-12]MCQ4949076.1 guanylate kinase [Bittarella massiliensis (ex Durand et al. 2017)]